MSDERRPSVITEDDLNSYQKLSKFCPIKEDVAELSKKIELLFTNFATRIENIETKIDGIQKIVVEQKVVQKYMENALSKLQDSYDDLLRKNETIVSKKDVAIYLTITSVFILILAALIPVLFIH